MREAVVSKLLEVVFRHPITLFFNALGVPTQSVVEMCRDKNMLACALTGAREHAVKHAPAGVDILVFSDAEASGHCGKISIMVVVPDVIEFVKSNQDIFILAAGGEKRGGRWQLVWR